MKGAVHGFEKRCVFCGKPPTNKNKEHILPRWLLALTGDPARTVTMAIDPASGKAIRFSWSQLVMPACEACNLRYSGLEAKVKGIVLTLLNRQPINSRDAFLLLDWLDKVRVGLWLNQMTLQKNASHIEPHLHIENRIGKKDRMLFVYTFDGGETGLNAFGIETLIFQHQPSCFALRINDIVLFNASSDYAFSHNCGFWHPARVERIVDGEFAGQVKMVGSVMTRKLTSPVIDFPLLKAPLRFVQPIAQRGLDGEFLGTFRQNDSYHFGHMADPEAGAGVLFRQWDDRVEPIHDLSKPFVFDEVDGDHGAMKDIIAQVYRFQSHLFEGSGLSGSDKAIEYAEGCRGFCSGSMRPGP